MGVLVRVLQRNKANSIKFMYIYKDTWGFPGGSVAKNPPANEGDMGSIPELGRSPGEGNESHSSILAWKIPWT